MGEIHIVSLVRIGAADRAKIEAADPRVRLTDASAMFEAEYRETWPAFTVARYLPPADPARPPVGTREERDTLLASADVVLGGWPFPRDLRARAPRMKWFHQRPAGASNLLGGDLWGSGVLVTTSRGAGNTLAIAEYAIAGILHLAKGFNRVPLEREGRRFDHRAYRPWLLQGKTLLVVGAGGIGLEAGRLGAALGFSVVGTRRTARPDQPLPPGFSEVGGAGDLDRLLPLADVVAICCHWTPETTNLFNAARLAAMKPGAILINVARGEIVEEAALIDALARNHLRGAVLDVYVGEFDRAPPEALWGDPRVVVTPHVSGNSDQDRHGAMEVFRENLAAWIGGRPLRNVIDWGVGY